MKKFHPTRAVTLVEVMITLAIFSVMLASVYSTFLISQRSWSNFAENIAPKQDLRRAMATMTTELREAKNIAIIKDDHSIQMTFERPKTGFVTYKWDNTGEDAGKILRKNYSTQTILARNITSASFVSNATDEVIIDISAGAKQHFSLKEKIALRSQTGLFIQSENEKIK